MKLNINGYDVEGDVTEFRQMFGITVTPTATRKNVGVKRSYHKTKTSPNRHNVWSQKDIEYIKVNREKIPGKTLAKHLGRTTRAVYTMSCKINKGLA